MDKDKLKQILKDNLRVSVYEAGDLYVEIYFDRELVCRDSIELDYIRR